MNERIKRHKNQPVKRYMPGLDGLRALCVLAVIAYHLNLEWAEGGLLGVGIFFVLSGYLITDQIMMEWKKERRLRLLKFWVRRMRRLLPAMVVMLLFAAFCLLFLDPSRLHGFTGGMVSSLLYVNNWWLIFHQVSYFESFGPPSPIGHLWSLSIEEQFYLVWPIILAAGLKLAPYRGKLLLWILAGAAASALAMAWMYTPGTDPSRVYYGTDTRAFSLLVGAALAVVWPSWQLSGSVSAKARGLLDLTGGLGLLLLLLLIFLTGKFDDSLYHGGFLFLSTIAAAVIAVLAHPASRLGKVMGCKPLRWIGVRSYSLYLWHFPVIILSSPDGNTEEVSAMRIALQLAISLILAALSYRYVEEPLRRGRMGINQGRTRQPASRRLFHRPYVLAALLMILLIPIYRSMSMTKPEPNASPPPAAQAWTQNEQTKPDRGKLDAQPGEGMTVIGDSVILDAAPFLEERLPGVVIDGQVGRQMRHVREVIDELQDQGKLGDRIIIELGSNGSFHADLLRSLLTSLDDKKVFLINTRVPREWQDSVNRAISEVGGEFNNTTVINWHSASRGKDHYFAQDGVHLNAEGARYYASLIANAVRDASG